MMFLLLFYFIVIVSFFGDVGFQTIYSITRKTFPMAIVLSETERKKMNHHEFFIDLNI